MSAIRPWNNESAIVDGLHLVSGKTRDTTYHWWIDPEKDWNVVKTEVLGGENKVIERKFLLKQNPHDGIWFPYRVETWSYAPDVVNPINVMEMHATEFNRVDHPVVLAPADIGVEVGTFVVFHEREENAAGYWTAKMSSPTRVSAARGKRRVINGPRGCASPGPGRGPVSFW